MTFKVFTLGATLLALAACGDNGQNPANLRGASFVSAGDAANITLSFDENEMRFYGQVVNLYNGSYSAAGDRIKFDQGATTMMMGPADAMTAERDYFQFLTKVEKYNLNDGTLTLTADDGKTMTFTQVEAPAPSDDNTVVTEEVQAVVVDTPVAE